MSLVVVRPDAPANRPDALDQTAQPSGAIYAATQGAHGLYRLPVEVRGSAFSAIVDTGASAALIVSQDQARQMGLKPGGARGTVATAQGTAAIRWVRGATVKIGETTLGGVDIGVVDAPLPDPLIGLAALHRLGTVTLSAGGLRIEPTPPPA